MRRIPSEYNDLFESKVGPFRQQFEESWPWSWWWIVCIPLLIPWMWCPYPYCIGFTLPCHSTLPANWIGDVEVLFRIYWCAGTEIAHDHAKLFGYSRLWKNIWFCITDNKQMMWNKSLNLSMWKLMVNCTFARLYNEIRL